jgi:hypothetical protein
VGPFERLQSAPPLALYLPPADGCARASSRMATPRILSISICTRALLYNLLLLLLFCSHALAPRHRPVAGRVCRVCARWPCGFASGRPSVTSPVSCVCVYASSGVYSPDAMRAKCAKSVCLFSRSRVALSQLSPVCHVYMCFCMCALASLGYEICGSTCVRGCACFTPPYCVTVRPASACRIVDVIRVRRPHVSRVTMAMLDRRHTYHAPRARAKKSLIQSRGRVHACELATPHARTCTCTPRATCAASPSLPFQFCECN